MKLQTRWTVIPVPAAGLEATALRPARTPTATSSRVTATSYHIRVQPLA